MPTKIYIKAEPDKQEDRLIQMIAQVQTGEVFEIIHESSERPVAVLLSHADYETLMGALTKTQSPTVLHNREKL